MHGIVLVELKKYVEQTYGASTWTALQLAADVPGRMHTAMGSYPDAEVAALVTAAAEATGRTVDEVLEAFGRSLAPGLMTTYGFLVKPTWDALDLVEHAEETIHTVVRARDGGSPPVLEVVRVRDDLVTVRYSSARRMCALAKGIVQGIGDHYRTPLEVRETTCMRSKAPFCQLEVSPLRVVPPAPRTAPERSISELPLW